METITSENYPKGTPHPSLAGPAMREAAPFRPRWWFWVLLFSVVLLVTGEPALQRVTAHQQARWLRECRQAAGLYYTDPLTKEAVRVNVTVQDAGDATYNGTYAESGAYNGQPAYTNGSRWLFWDGALRWVLAESKGASPAYSADFTPDLPGNPWGVEGGTAPAPTVALAVYTLRGFLKESDGTPIAGVIVRATRVE